MTDCGFITIPSVRFREICDKCASAVLFSCSEGMSTSLLTSMRMGLLPVTCKGNGMEICGDHVILSDGYHMSEIERAMEQVIEMSDSEYVGLSRRIYKDANENFTLDRFDEIFRKAMGLLLKE